MKRALLVVAAAAAILAGGPVAAADGKAVYEKACKGCHTGMNPKVGDKAAWAPLIAQGDDALTASVMKGKKPMPPRGGAKSEEEVKAAVQYMISLHK